MKKEYKIVIFDLDDTIIDNKSNVKYAFEMMMKKLGIEVTESDFQSWYEIDKRFWKDRQDGLIIIPEYLKEEEKIRSPKFIEWLRAQRMLIYLKNEVSLEEAIKLNNLFMEELKTIVNPIDGIEETLRYLSDKYLIIVATNGPTLAAEEKLRKIDCLKFVKKVFAADMFGYMKPSEKYFNGITTVLENKNLKDYIIIGDSLKSDICFAMNCGFDSIWYDRLEENLTDEYKPTYIVKKINQIKKIL